MKLPSVILITLAFNLSFGQSLDEIRNRLRILEKLPDFGMDTTGLSSLPRIEYGCGHKNQTTEYYHVADLNNDGRNDLLYSGPCKGSSQAAIFINTGKSLKKIYDNLGRIISVEKNGSKTSINIFKEASRCDFFSQYTEIVINNKSEMSRHTIVFGAQTKISVAARLREDKVVGTIRTTPHVNDVVKRDACNNTVRGNQLTRIHDFRDVVQINKVGPWWLVLYPETGDRAWIGWMKLE